ncbi:hypothetical protein BDV35DRAFT_385211 [Aspergillus flavus]|uniref:Uncharacterized protein n=1 Tax=Aspergillus flavus TaxID=5059 RepID=A0A5N6GH04_ASPFL|nr:hypothetical protein BDV35DRAFT_385211 [Aspergillus flavus]
MQDFDIDAQYPAITRDPAVRPWDESFVMGIRLAKLQGEIYDKLYSAEAAKSSHPERMRRVHGLALDIQQWYAEFKETSGFHTKADYANWVLLFSSFTPFIVIFLHAIAATSSDDIQLLNEVVESLQHIRYVSPSSERLYQICSTFLQIARELVKTRQSCVGAYNQLEDSLQFATDAGPMSIFEPDCLQSLFGTDTSEYAPFLADHDMCAIFDSWATGVPAGVNLFGGDVGELDFVTFTILVLYASTIEDSETAQFVQIKQAAETPCPAKSDECKPVGSVPMSVDVVWKGEKRESPTCDIWCFSAP